MSLEAGTRLGHYEVVSSLGAGGMGEVYRARDTKLGREVAIKFLLEEVSTDPERLARFEREARVLASLNHNNIATLYGFESEGDKQFLVMEVVEGETLADRIKRGAIPVDEALPLFLQIAEGLEAAHEKGVIHRDLKPANIKIGNDGGVKILDFGLAKAMAPADSTESDPSESPTVTAVGFDRTYQGQILGTAPYLSPEQARGKEADHRADIWAFGCVLFEALTGCRPFDGDTVTDLLAAIVKEEPAWSDLPAETPVSVRRVLRRCLTKSARDRLQAIGDARIELRESREELVAQDDDGRPAPGPLSWAQAVAIGVLATVAAASLTWWVMSRRAPQLADETTTRAVARSSLDLPEDATLALGRTLDLKLLALSPDGTKLVYVGDFEASKRLYLRSLDHQEVTPLAGTEGAQTVFFSPDGLEVGFFTRTHVKKISLRGGAPMALCASDSPRRGVWVDDGRIYFQAGGRLVWVSEDGGTITAVPRPLERSRRLSDVLPGGGRALFSVPQDNSISADYSDIYLGSLDSPEAVLLIESGYDARYVESGHIVFARAGHLMAIAFDIDRLEVIGDPVSAVSDVAMHSFFPHAQFAISANGTLAYATGGDLALGKLAWIDRDGKVEFLPVPERLYGPVDISADAGHIAVQVSDVTDYVWVWDVEREEGRSIAMDGASGWPTLDASGRRVAVGTKLANGWAIAVQDLEGRTKPQVVFSIGDPNPLWGASWTRDGAVLAFSQSGAEPFVPVPAQGIDGLQMLPALWSSSFSPDGRWIVYPDEAQVWARSYPDGKNVHQISVDVGSEPIWCDQCDEIFYVVGGGKYKLFMSARVTSGEELEWEPPTRVFEAGYIETQGRSYDVSPDGQRILVSKRTREPERRRILLVQNWFEELKRLVPTD